MTQSGHQHLTRTTLSKCWFSQARVGMLERLGNALYWLGCILAAILIAVSVYVFATDSTGLGIAMSIAYALTAVAVWLLGWVFRYVLSGS